MNQEEMLEDLANRIQQMQIKARDIAQQSGRSMPLRRAFHAKGMGLRAKFKINSNVPKDLQVGFFQPNAEYEALIRFSNTRSEVLGDLEKDQRGTAIRVKTIAGSALAPDDYSNVQDFLMANTPTSFARDPVQVVEVAEIFLEGTSQAPGKLIRKYGFREAWRIMGEFLKPLIGSTPLQLYQYWSRATYKFGDTSIRYLMRPAAGSKTLSSTQQIFEGMRSTFQSAA